MKCLGHTGSASGPVRPGGEQCVEAGRVNA
jgi:hypothetical protein